MPRTVIGIATAWVDATNMVEQDRRYSSTEPIVRLHPTFFRDEETGLPLDQVEQATAAPGERRNVHRP